MTSAFCAPDHRLRAGSGGHPTQQEDNATYLSLPCGDASGLMDLDRVAVLRAASNFERPYPRRGVGLALALCLMSRERLGRCHARRQQSMGSVGTIR